LRYAAGPAYEQQMRVPLARSALALTVVIGLSPAGTATAGPPPHSPYAACDAFDPTACLLPFPNDLFTVADPTSPTGRRVHFEPSSTPATPGGTPGHYRDNHVQYMLTHPTEYTAIGVFAIVFSGGGSTSANITTDGGQFARLFTAYLANPAALAR